MGLMRVHGKRSVCVPISFSILELVECMGTAESGLLNCGSKLFYLLMENCKKVRASFMVSFSRINSLQVVLT